jgi:NAD(P)-dependent dehydrogenase (short-subunit alcohol dehydrogenase family)
VAGVSDGFGSVDTLRDEDWDRIMAINATAPTLLMREVVPIMRQHGGGSIVNVGSTASHNGGMAGVAYTASKHALLGVSKQTAWRYRNEQIRVNVVAPGNC